MKKSFLSSVCGIAIPVALQSMIQSSFSLIDQIMLGQLGGISVAGVGLAGKFASIFSVASAAIGGVAGVMISQYLGQRKNCAVRKSFLLNMALSMILAVGFSLLCAMFPNHIMGLYTEDVPVLATAAGYLRLLSGSFLPAAGSVLLSVLFRCMEKARLPLYASLAAAVLNTGLNYLLIFGRCGFAAMGAEGAAIATVISQTIQVLILLLMLARGGDWKRLMGEKQFSAKIDWRQYAGILLPAMACELAWSLGENVYSVIYGRMGLLSCAAMTLMNPIQGLMLGALCGLSQAAGVIVGKELGNGEYDRAYQAARRLLLYGAVASIPLCVLIIAISPYYVEIYHVETEVKRLAQQILFSYALIAPFKVQNMILGGGIIRSGGKTKYVMLIDIAGTWLFGVPLGMLAAFVLRLSIPYVYLLLSLEECVRFGLSIAVLRRRIWMRQLDSK